MTRLIALGECMVEMVQQPDGLYKRVYGGDSFNMAYYCAWIGAAYGVTVSYATALGTDKFGRAMIPQWEKDGIDTSLVQICDTKNTGLYFADTDRNGQRDYVMYRSDSAAKKMFRLPGSAAWADKLLDCDMLYASAISLMILNDEDRERLVHLFEAARRQNIRTAFDTNYRPSGWKNTDEAALWMNKIMKHADIVLPTDDENCAVFGDTSAQETLDRLRTLGVPEIAVKCGAQGCMVNGMRVPSLPGIAVVDTTSAGDSFNAAYLCARLNGLEPEKAALWGHRMAAEVIQHRGALIPRDQLDINSLFPA